MVWISDKDLFLIQTLTENARTAFVKIAEKLNVSETTIRKKVKQLLKEGVIEKFTLQVNPKKLGFEITGLIGVDTKPEAYVQTLEELKQLREVKKLWSTTGDHMIMAECWFKNSSELMQFIKKLEFNPNITKVCPAIIVERLK
ncbi:Lrp/AsnC family transcriptional regulator [Candidatus Woesearchaeota archaeon]|nr:Lrp/AsnC family transcriptional regulator [Candidatus Woesearchaeota archaeon]